MQRIAWLLLAIIPILLGVYIVKRSLIPVPVSGGQGGEFQAGMTAGQGAGATDKQTTIIGPSFMDLDPFAVLDKQYEAQRTAETARFDEEETGIRARIQPALDASEAKYRSDMEALDRKNLTAAQKSEWTKGLSTQHERAWLEIKRTIQSDLDEWAARRKEALAKLESDRAAKRARLEEIRALAEKGQIDPVAAKRSQFEALGISLPDSAFQAPEAAGDRQGQPDPQTAGPQDPTPKVGAVITVDNRFCALIGDALVSEGDTVQGYRVHKIHADRVEFEKDGQTWVQRVH